MDRHCHINREVKQYFNIDNTGEIDRGGRIPERHGHPHKNVSMQNGEIHYNATSKTRRCQICMETDGRYGWRGIINHLNSKLKTTKPQNQKVKRPQVRLAGGDAVHRGVDFGLVSIAYGKGEYKATNTDLEEGRNRIKCGEI